MDSLLKSEMKFYTMLESKIKVVCLYENINLLKYAADIIPTDELSMKATLKLSVEEDGTETERGDFDDYLLLELLNWFKYSFFNWVDTPECESCNQMTVQKGFVPPTESEAYWGASRVENYYCSNCNLNIRFPRYNHPKKLLETRRGRCGEWANCFTFLCRALGYDARLIFDWNDHVWTEVYSFSQKRWVHYDPCENVCDKPLLYEIGWKKPISYIIAFSKDEIQDVTWRYTSKFVEVLKRRNLCQEYWLINCLLRLTDKLQTKLSTERKNELRKRRVLELAQFITEPKADEALGGRTSGSLAWRLARKETDCTVLTNSYIFRLNEKEIKNKKLHVKYSCAFDKYVRVSDLSNETERWSSCVYSFSNIMRKVELDWKTVYLARTEGSSTGLISWKFDFNESNLVIQAIKFHLKSSTFENGNINWCINSDCVDFSSKMYSVNDGLFLQTKDFKGCASLTISAELTEGKGPVAWQHSQLFRQTLDSPEYPFEIEIYFEQL